MPRMTLFKKILIITLLLTLMPLLATSLILFSNLEKINTRLATEIASDADTQASGLLQMRAQQVADNVSDFLHQCESDLQFLARSNLDRRTLLNFYATRRGEVWERRGTAEAPRETRELIPLYSSIAVIDRNGHELTVIRDGNLVPASALANISRPAQTEFRSEDYFQRIKALGRGEVYVSHLTGFHVSRQEQLAGADEPENAYGGANYHGVIRFGAPLFDRTGHFNGMVVISLDHHHLMEFTQHIDPGRNFLTIFPSYKSGNYAFLFDDEGWIITHPKYWDIRGLDRQGRLLAPYSENSVSGDVQNGRIPFNLDRAGFIHTNYPRVAEMVRQQKTGSVDITNVGGAKKIMAFAPIRYDTGDYRRYGIFGGVTIGFQVDQFHDLARKESRMINRQLGQHRTLSAIILMSAALLAGLAAWGLARGITKPLRQLNEGARMLAEGDTHNRVNVTSGDEIGELAGAFNFLADELELRKISLHSTLDELRRSRLEILDERNFKESILESISSAILTFSPQGLLTSINGTGHCFLGNDIAVDMHFNEVFRGWSDMPQRIAQALTIHSGYGREPLTIGQGADMVYFEVGFFPIGNDAEQGLTVTMRNETEREKLREEMTRLDRLASLGKLAAGIAHEVRNPLTGISLLLDDLHDRTASASGDQVMIKKAAAEIERVERLITALLNYSSPVRAEFREGDLNAVVHDALLLIRRQCERCMVVIEQESLEIPVFRFDPEKIKQALLNVVKNSLEAMPGGGRIVITASSDEKNALVVISDNGPGIAPDDLPLIFEPFFTRKGAGTGLGLSITHRIIVEEHHGRISVESDGVTGTRFILALPLTMT